MFLIYSFFYTITIITLFLPQYFKRPKKLRQKWLKEKLGYLPEVGSAIWIHAVSVGEVGASMPLIKKLRKQYPGHKIILSTITDTGQKVAQEKALEDVTVIYLPFDLTFVLERALTHIKPKLFIVIETELWPNIFRVLGDKGVPVIVLNGRLSEQSMKGYRKISFFMKKVFSNVRFFGMQSQIDADRIKKIGADNKMVSVLGNFKFDINIPKELPAWTKLINGPVIVAGSTHKGEEDIIISEYVTNLDTFPELKLIIAPRHPERFAEVEDILKVRGMEYIKRSEIGTKNDEPRTLGTKVILLDSVGELTAVYGIADIAVIGKSFVGFGGQNPLEPACWGKPIICGPHMENFPFIREFYHEGAAFEVEARSLGRKIRELLDAPEKAKIAGGKAKSLFMKNSGAGERAIKIIGDYIGPS